MLLTEALMSPKANREKMMQLVIEACNAPSVYVGIQAVLSQFSSGWTTDIVFDADDLISHKVPISEDYSPPRALMLPNLTEWLHFHEVR
jgi:actin